MKQCPTCRLDYDDDTLNFCLEDGTPLVYRPPVDEPVTAILAESIGEMSVSTDRSIVVLPFVNISADTENEYFCDGLAEELLNALTKVDGLKVAARTSAFSFKNRSATVKEIASALGVNTILDGSVRKSGNRLRITAQLVSAADGYQLWSEGYDRETGDVLDIQDEITMAVIDALKFKLLGSERADVLKRDTGNTDAYHLYLRGRFFWNKRTEAAIRKAIQYFDQAIELDPVYAAAYTGLSDCYTLLVVREAIAPDDGFAKAKSNALVALRIDPCLAEAHASLGHAHLHYWNWNDAENALRESFKLKPGYPSAHQWYSEYLTAMGRHEEGIAELKLAADLDPLSLVIGSDLGRAFYYAREYDQALSHEAAALEMDPSFWLAHINLGRSYIQLRRYAEAIAELRTANEALPGNTEALAFLGFAHAAAEERSEAMNILDKLSEISNLRRVPQYHFALVNAGLGEVDLAFDHLERAYEDHAVDFFTLNVEPMLDSLRPSPVFADLVRRVGL